MMVRMFGLNALAAKRDPGLAGFLLTQATRDDASNDYRAAAIRALGQTGNRDYVSRLESIAFSPDSSRSMQESAKQAINQLMGRQVYPIR